MISVWLVRYVAVRGADKAFEIDGTYALAVDLPFAPFPGLGLPVDPDLDPSPIESVFINAHGAVVCRFGNVLYGYSAIDLDDDVVQSEAAARGQIEFHTRGWIRLPEGLPEYRLIPAPPGGRFPSSDPEAGRAWIRPGMGDLPLMVRSREV